MLAYSTVSALGLLMMLFGLGSEMAVTSALVYLVAHAGYKGALFLIAGTLEHETGTRDVTGSRRSAARDAGNCGCRVFWLHVQWRAFLRSPGLWARNLSTRRY